MSRLWSRFGIRAISVVLLLVGVVGGVYLGRDREFQQQGIEAQLAVQADLAEQQLLKDRHSEHSVAVAPQREAEAEAAAKAAGAAQAAAERAQKAKVAVSRKKERQQKAAEDNAAAKPYAGPIPKSCNQYTGNRKIGCAVLLNTGFGLDQMPCLDKLWSKESGWNHRAANPSSGAYGIPQALPGGKMASAGADWRNSPATQIKWGLGYIKGRYGSPCRAWGHSQSVGWY